MAKIRLDFTQEEVEKALIDYWTEKHNMREKGSSFRRTMGDKFPNPKIEWIMNSDGTFYNGAALVIGTDEEPYKPMFEAGEDD